MCGSTRQTGKTLSEKLAETPPTAPLLTKEPAPVPAREASSARNLPKLGEPFELHEAGQFDLFGEHLTLDGRVTNQGGNWLVLRSHLSDATVLVSTYAETPLPEDTADWPSIFDMSVGDFVGFAGIGAEVLSNDGAEMVVLTPITKERLVIRREVDAGAEPRPEYEDGAFYRADVTLLQRSTGKPIDAPEERIVQWHAEGRNWGYTHSDGLGNVFSTEESTYDPQGALVEVRGPFKQPWPSTPDSKVLVRETDGDEAEFVLADGDWTRLKKRPGRSVFFNTLSEPLTDSPEDLGFTLVKVLRVGGSE